ncbi:hypothetical protein [uncultured Roseobacter sp.]|uniref:hypothetical protein n=1 Tax=uncultured Roseobacter sp. TaxID=114847 RepID=UPI00261B225E|nr:hypothetical protein [uncultured Roseobacter sp.]
MSDTDFTATSRAQMDAVGQAVGEEAFAPAPEEEISVRNFGFTADMLPGWIFARAREIDTGRGVRLIQVNAQATGSESMARIEILETEDAGQGRALFMETLARFQRDPADLLRIPPRFAEAEAVPGQGTFVFLRGNLVVTVASIGAVILQAEDLAEALDQSICKKPQDASDSKPVTSGRGADRTMVKSFTRRTARGDARQEAFAISPDGSVARVSDSDEPGQKGSE